MNHDAMDQDSRGRMIITAGSICCAIATTATTLRLFTRGYINRQIGLDDWIAIVALFCTYGMAISQGINALKCLGQHEWEFDVTLDIPGFFETFWITALFYNAALLFIKLTFLFQYFRIFRQVQSMRNAYLIAIVLVTSWNIGQVFTIAFICLPVAGFWDKTIDASCQDQRILVYVNAAGNMITDIIIIMLPLPALWKLQLPRSQKIAVFGVFGVGSITLIISIIRLTTIHTDKIDDFTYDTWTSACFSVAELASGITCAALATLRPLFGRLFPSLFLHSHQSAVQYDANDKHPPTIGSANSDRKRKPHWDDEKAWAANIHDIDLGSLAPSLPGTPRKTSLALDRYQEEVTSIRAFQMLKPRLGSVTNIISPRLDGQPTFLDTDDALPSTLAKSGIKIEREFEVRESHEPYVNTSLHK